MPLIIQMKKHFDARSSEWFNAALLATWGATLILEPGMFDGPLAITFTGMRYLAHQEVWGFGAFVVGAIRLVALLINGLWSITPMVRVVTSFLSVFVWFWICVGLAKVGIFSPGLVVYPYLVLIDMYSASRAASDAYESEAQKRLKDIRSSENSNVANFPAKFR